MESRVRVIVLVIGVVVVVGLVFWLRRGAIVATAPQQDTAKIYQFAAQVKNPIGNKLPQTNPFESAKTNPLKNVYQNPF